MKNQTIVYLDAEQIFDHQLIDIFLVSFNDEFR